MRLAKWRADMDRAWGERIFLDALTDYATGQLRRRQAPHLLATVIAVLILLTPVLVALAGIATILSALPSLGGVFFGGALLAAGVFLRPVRYKIPKDALTRADAPEFFGALDEVRAAMQAPEIDHVVITDDFNAFAAEAGRHRVLGIGALLWQAATPGERQALIAHEVAHLVNDDPARGRLIGWSLQTLDKWDALLTPDSYYADNVVGEIVLLPLRLLVDGLERTMLRLLYLQSQRAEYLADALAADAAGPRAVTRLLETVSLVEHVESQWTRLHGLGAARGQEVLDLLVSPLTAWDDTERNTLLKELNTGTLSIDGTHPPTGYRIGFIDALPVSEPKLRPDLFAEHDQVIAKQLTNMGEKLAVVFEVQ